jgi:hypothetical protein
MSRTKLPKSSQLDNLSRLNQRGLVVAKVHLQFLAAGVFDVDNGRVNDASLCGFTWILSPTLYSCWSSGFLRAARGENVPAGSIYVSITSPDGRTEI